MKSHRTESQSVSGDVVDNLTELANTFGSDKGTRIGDWGTAHGYTRIYHRFLEPRRCEPLKLLEIGVWKGASLRMWEQFFPHARIVGIDILSDALRAASERSQVVIGDASDRDFLKQVVDTHFGGTVDVVVDDGSHVLDHQVTAIETLFPLLSEGGWYFIEDISVSRFDVKGVARRPFADFLDYVAWLTDQTTFWDGNTAQQYHTILNVDSLAANERLQLIPNYWNEWLDAVHIFYNMCILEKRRRTLPVPIASQAPSVLGRSVGVKYASEALKQRCTDVELMREGPFANLLDETEAKLVALEIQISVATKLAQHSDSIPAAVSTVIEQARGQVESFRHALRAVERASSTVVTELSRATLNAEKATKKLNHVEAEVELLRNRLNALPTENAPQAQIDASRGQLLEIEKEKKEADRLRDQLADLNAALDKKAEENGEAEVWIKALQDKLAGLEKEKEAADHFRDELAALKAALEKKAVEHGEAEARIEALQGQLAGLKKEKEAADRLRDDLAALNAALDEKAIQNAEAEAEINALQGQLTVMKDLKDVSDTQRDETHARVDRLEMELARGSAEIAQIRLIHAGMWGSWQSAKSELERSNTKCQMLEQELGALSAARDKKATENAEAQLQIDSLQRQLADLGKEKEAADYLGRRAAELEMSMIAVHESTSWRVTAPLRWLGLVVQWRKLVTRFST
jgi:hypothetical protein